MVAVGESPLGCQELTIAVACLSIKAVFPQQSCLQLVALSQDVDVDVISQQKYIAGFTCINKQFTEILMKWDSPQYCFSHL